MIFANALRRSRVLILALLLFAAVPVVLNGGFATAITLGPRSTHLGTSVPGAQTTHTHTFGTIIAATIGSIRFEYCVNDPFAGQPCVAPAGIDVSTALIASQTGISGLSVHGNTTSNDLVLTRVAGNVNPTTITIRTTNVTNPTTLGSMYVRISTYPTTDGTGPFDQDGGVGITIQNGVGTSVIVPPYLTFCTGITVSSNCSSATGAYVGLGELSPAAARIGTSQYAGATNDFGGFAVSMIGSTMTSGNNIVPALNTPTNSIPGTSQFGINLRANSNPAGGLNPSGAGVSTPTSSYNNVNQFTFVPGATISSSTHSTAYNVMTVSYMVNVSTSQSPGVYTTTLTYIAVAAF